MTHGLYLGKMSYSDFSAMARSMRAPILEFNKFRLLTISADITFKCDGEYYWMYRDVPISQIAGRCGKRL